MNTRGDRRRRWAKACDSCRKSKVRCDGSRPFCGRCLRSENDCHYADVNKADARRRLRKRASLSSLGDMPGQGSLSEINVASAQTRDFNVAQVATHPHRGAEPRNDADSVNNLGHSSPVQALETTDTSPGETIVGGSGDMRYFGPHSGVSLFSRVAPRESGQQPPESWSQWTHPSIESIFKKRETRPLPPWAEAFSLVTEFFCHEHQSFPCYNPPAFMSLLGQQYSSACAENPAWWASLNAVLAIAQRRRAEITQSAEAENIAWEYATNALDSCLNILMRSTQLLSVQAILSVAWFFIGTPNPQPSFMLIGCAVRLAHSIGIHSNNHDSSSNVIDAYMKKRVFWIAACLDHEFCLRTGRPTCHDLEAFFVDAPTGSPDETEIVTTGAGLQINLFKAQSRLATIHSSIHHELLSSKSSPACIAGSILSFMDRLREWCSEFAPSLLEKSMQRHEHLGLTRLYLSYYNTVIITNRANSFNYWVPLNKPARSNLTTDINASIDNCLTASRSIIELCHSVPDYCKSFYWHIVPVALNAILILCICILRDPTPETTETDLQSVYNTLQLFKALDEPYRNTYLTQIRKICQELYERARHTNKLSEVQPSRPLQWGNVEGQASISDTQYQRGQFTHDPAVNNIFEPGLDTGERSMPYSAPLLWDMDLPLWATFP